MKLTDILSEDARAAGRDLRIEHYLDEACTFLEFAYDDDAALADPIIRRSFARACYERSQDLGISALREHLGYLSTSVICGYAFEANPLYQSALDRAGWIDDRWQVRRAPDPAATVAFAEQWQQLAALECEDPATLLEACRDAIAALDDLAPSDPAAAADLAEGPPVTGAATGPATATATGAAESGNGFPSQAAPPIPRTLQLALLRQAWPNRSAILPERLLAWFCDLLSRNIVQQRMPADVAVVFSALSFHLGIFFFHDPRYSALSSAFAQRDADPVERSDQIATAIRHLLELSPSNQGTLHG